MKQILPTGCLLLILCFIVPLPAQGRQGSSSLPAAPAKASGDQVQQKLDAFARRTISSINRAVLPSSLKKEVSRNNDGTFTARYIEVDPDTISTSYLTPEDSALVSYIGYMHYVEIEYICTARDQKGALNGPFIPRKRAPVTEIIKYIKGKWTY
ncbi:MAG: hypothetical protein LBO77_02975 [Desulfovibrio sp.]|jgi:hypothetical protein|nr:hypothetical protein [Desulfovibrio sp.]